MQECGLVGPKPSCSVARCSLYLVYLLKFGIFVSMRLWVFIFIGLIAGLLVETATAHQSYWSTNCSSSTCCSSDSATASFPSESNDEESTNCHPFDACHSCFHIVPDAAVDKAEINRVYFAAFTFLAPCFGLCSIPFEGPPPK
jgi:hypothetical protein